MFPFIFLTIETISSLRQELDTEIFDKEETLSMLNSNRENIERVSAEESRLRDEINSLRASISESIETTEALRSQLMEEKVTGSPQGVLSHFKSSANNLRKRCEDVRDNLDNIVAALAKANEEESIARQQLSSLNDRDYGLTEDVNQMKSRVQVPSLLHLLFYVPFS